MAYSAERFRRGFDAALRGRDIARAARLLEANCDILLAQGQADLFARCVSEIPQRVQSFHPRLMLALAWRLIAQWKFEQVADLFAAIRLRLSELERGETDPEEIRRLRHALRHREMMLALTRDDMWVAENHCRLLIAERYGADAYVKGSLYTSLLHARYQQFKLSDVDRLDTQATDYLSEKSNANSLFIHNCVAALAMLALGRSDEAIGRLRRTVDDARALGPNAAPLAAIPALPLAEALYERGCFAEAQTLVSAHLPRASDMGIVDQLVCGYLTAARLAARAGDQEGALRILDEGHRLAAQRGFPRLAAWIFSERVAILARTHQLARLGKEQEHSLLQTRPDGHLPEERINTLAEAKALAWVRVAEAHCRVDDGLRVADAWSRRMQRVGALRSRIRWKLTGVRFLLLAGKLRLAARLLGEAVMLAAPGRFVAGLLEEPALIALLRRIYHEQPDTFAQSSHDFIKEILAHDSTPVSLSITSPDGERASLDRLSPREIDVLALVAAAWRNQDIANRLGLTEGTVKWYLQQIFDKLGVRKRSLAVDRARRFGIIHAAQ